MSLNLGQSIHPGQTDEETRIAGSEISEGDAVTIDSSDEIVRATDADVVYGIAGDDHVTDGYQTGDSVPVITQGPVVANVASGTSPAAELSVTTETTPATLGAGDSVKGIVSKHPEGQGQQDEIPDGAAHVDV